MHNLVISSNKNSHLKKDILANKLQITVFLSLALNNFDIKFT